MLPRCQCNTTGKHDNARPSSACLRSGPRLPGHGNPLSPQKDTRPLAAHSLKCTGWQAISIHAFMRVPSALPPCTSCTRRLDVRSFLYKSQRRFVCAVLGVAKCVPFVNSSSSSSRSTSSRAASAVAVAVAGIVPQLIQSPDRGS